MMSGWISRFCRRIGAALRKDDGTATIEFVIMFPVFVAILASSIEVSILSARQVMLDRAVDITVRELRLGQLGSPSHDQVRERICDRTMLIRQCENVLLLELRPVSMQTWEGLDDPVTCIDRAEETAPVTRFVAGQENELMMVHACSVADPIFPGTALAAALRKDSTGAYLFTSSSAFVNEPR